MGSLDGRTCPRPWQAWYTFFMPIHDWSPVDVGVFHDFHLAWIDVMRLELNARLLPEPFYVCRGLWPHRAKVPEGAGGVMPARVRHSMWSTKRDLTSAHSMSGSDVEN